MASFEEVETELKKHPSGITRVALSKKLGRGLYPLKTLLSQKRITITKSSTGGFVIHYVKALQ